MNERQPNGLPERPLVVREGIFFTPFGSLEELPLPKDHSTYTDSTGLQIEGVDYVASVKVALGALNFNLALAVPEDIYSPDFRREYRTPLGEVDLLHRYRDGQEATIATTLKLISFTTIDSLKNYIELNNYELEIKMGDEVFFLDCVETMPTHEAGESINGAIERDWEGGHFISRQLMDDQHEPTMAILPYDVYRLSSIEVKVVRKSE